MTSLAHGYSPRRRTSYPAHLTHTASSNCLAVLDTAHDLVIDYAGPCFAVIAPNLDRLSNYRSVIVLVIACPPAAGSQSCFNNHNRLINCNYIVKIAFYVSIRHAFVMVHWIASFSSIFFRLERIT